MHNRYYTINADDVNINYIAEVIVGTLDEQRYSLDRSKIVVKLHDGDHSEYEFLVEYQEYSHEEILIILQGAEWTGEPML